MLILFKKIEKKINGIIWTFVSTAVILLILAVLVVWTDFMIRLVFGMIILVIAYGFFYGAYKIYEIKKELKNYFKL